jgi:hypothetical protein
MTETERLRYVNTVKNASMISPYSIVYKSLVDMHTNLFFLGIHNTALFFPWHRFFLFSMENLFQMLDCRVTIPWWDWVTEAAAPLSSPLWGNGSSWFGGDGNPSGGCVTTGAFAFPGWTTPSQGCLTRSFAIGGTLAGQADLATAFALYALPSQYDLFRNRIENGPGLHGAVHCLIGGIMCSIYSANNPEFFLHHATIDYIWSRWQSQSPAHLTAYSGDPNAPMLGTTFPPSAFFDLNDQLGVSVCYERTSPYQPLHDWLTSLPTSTLSSITLTPVSPLASVMARMMGRSDVDQIVAAERARNTASNVISLQALRARDALSGRLGYALDYASISSYCGPHYLAQCTDDPNTAIASETDYVNNAADDDFDLTKPCY